MSVKRTLAKNSIFNLIGYGYVLIASFFSIPILLKSLGASTFGAYAVLAGIIPIAASFDFGLASSVIKHLSAPFLTKKDRVEIWKSSFFLFSVFGLLLGSVTFVLVRYFAHSMKALEIIESSALVQLAYVLGVVVFVNLLTQHFLAHVQAKQRFDLYNVRTLIVGTATTIVSAYAAKVSSSLYVIFVVQAWFYVAALAFLIAVSYKDFPGKKFLLAYNSRQGRKLGKFGIRYFVGQISSRIQAYTPKYYLGSFLGGDAVSYYSIPSSIVSNMLGGIVQIGTALFPLSSYLATKTGIKKIRSLIVKMELGILVLGLLQIVLVWAVGHEFLLWWLSDPHIASQSYQIWRILSVFFVFASVAALPSFILSGLNFPQIPSGFSAVSTLIQIALLIYFIPRYGVIGSSYAELITSAMVVPVYLIVFGRVIKNYNPKN